MEAEVAELREQLNDVLTDKTICDKLNLPDFQLVLTVVTDLNAGKIFAPGLFKANELGGSKLRRTKRKISFLVRLITFVQHVLGTTLKVQPAQIVSGANKPMILELLSAIAQASTVPRAHAKAAVKTTLRQFKEQKNKAKKLIRTVVRLQSIWRGHRARRRAHRAKARARRRRSPTQHHHTHGAHAAYDFRVPQPRSRASLASTTPAGSAIRLRKFLNSPTLTVDTSIRRAQARPTAEEESAILAKAKEVLRRAKGPSVDLAGRRASPERAFHRRRKKAKSPIATKKKSPIATKRAGGGSGSAAAAAAAAAAGSAGAAGAGKSTLATRRVNADAAKSTLATRRVNAGAAKSTLATRRVDGPAHRKKAKKVVKARPKQTDNHGKRASTAGPDRPARTVPPRHTASRSGGRAKALATSPASRSGGRAKATSPVTPRTRLRQSRKKLQEYTSGARRVKVQLDPKKAEELFDKKWLKDFDFEFEAALDRANRI